MSATRYRSRLAVLAGLTAFVSCQSGLNRLIRGGQLWAGDPVFAEKMRLLRRHPEFFAGPGDAGPLRLLVLGSSRTQFGLDAPRFAATCGGGRVRAFNFACFGAGPLTLRLYLDRALASGVRPDWVLVELHPALFAALEAPFEARWFQPFRLRAGEPATLRSTGWDCPDPPQHGWRGNLTAAHAYRLGLLDEFAPAWLPRPQPLTIGARGDESGSIPGVEIPPEKRGVARRAALAEYADAFSATSVGPAPRQALHDLLHTCEARGVRVALFVTPEATGFRQAYSPEFRAAFDGFAAGVSAEFRVPLFDARGWVPDEEFADGHHLSARGNRTFTDRLAREAAPWLRPCR